MDLNKYEIYKAYINTGIDGHNVRPILIAENSNSYTIYEILVHNITHDDTNEN